MDNRQKLIETWQHHSRISRRIIEKISEKDLFDSNLQGRLKPVVLISNLLENTARSLPPIFKHPDSPETIYNDKWCTKTEILNAWDERSRVLHDFLKKIPRRLLYSNFYMFGMYSFPILQGVWHLIEDHRYFQVQMQRVFDAKNTLHPDPILPHPTAEKSCQAPGSN